MKCPPGTLTREQRLEILRKLTQEKPITKLSSELGVGRASIYRYLKQEREIPPDLDPKLCSTLNEDEILSILNNKQLLESLGLVKNNELNLPLLLTIVNVVLEHPEGKEVVLKQVTKRFKSELQELLSTTLPRIQLEWSGDFEKYLTEKKSKPISQGTLRDYRNVWFNCLEGKTLGWHLLKQLEAKKMKCSDNEYHPTGWIRQVFRHYVSFLYSIGKLDWDTYSRLRIIVPGRRYGRKLSQKVIRREEFIRTIRIFDEKSRGDLLTLYIILYSSGARLKHVLQMFNEWNPSDVIYVQYLNRDVKRLECFKKHCRYYMGKENSIKPVAFIYFPRFILPLVKTYVNRLPGRYRITKVARKWNCLAPSKVRTLGMRDMRRVIKNEEVVNFILGKFSELTVTSRHYMDLLSEADNLYPRYVDHVLEVFNTAIQLPNLD